MATTIKCVECPERVFDNPGSARGHANRLGHHTVEVDEALTVASDDSFPQMTGEVGAELESLSATIRSEYDAGRQAYRRTWDAYRSIAVALARARELLRGDLEYGRWIKEQDFPFQGVWARLLLKIGENIDEAQALVDTSIEEGGEVPGIRKIAKAVSPPKERPEPADEDFDDEAEPDEAPNLTADQVINRFLYSPAVEVFSSAPDPESAEGRDFWSTIDPATRRTYMREFAKLVNRMAGIGDIWKEEED